MYKLGHLTSIETDQVSASLYIKEDGEYTVWLKVGVALIEIPEDFMITTIDTLNELHEHMLEMAEKGENNV